MALTAGGRWRVGIGPWTGTDPVIEVSSFSGTFNLSENLDAGAACTFSLPMSGQEVVSLSEYETDVWVYEAGVLRFRGRVTGLAFTWGAESGSVTVTAVDYSRLLYSRLVSAPLSFTATDQGVIMQALIDQTQALPGGDLGIGWGTIDSGSVLRDREYVIGDVIGDAIDNLSAAEGGVCWKIDADRLLQVEPYDACGSLALPLRLGEALTGLSRSSVPFANSILASGDSGFTTPVLVDSADILTDPRGRWERAFGFPTVTLQDTLIESAAGLLARAAQHDTWNMQIDPARFALDARVEPGQMATVVMPSLGAGDVAMDCQLMNVSITVDPNGGVTVAATAIEVG